MHYILTHEKEIKILQKQCPTEILQFSSTEVLTVECFRGCLMPSGGLIDMASFLSLMNMLSIILTHHRSMPGHSQASNTAGIDREKNKIVTSCSALKVGQGTVLMHYSCSCLKTLKGAKGIKRIRACYLWSLFLHYIYMVCSVALSGVRPAENLRLVTEF